jgi:hypothetical protein
MSRFKELKRIEAAIKNSDKADLGWAESYCAMRIQIATRKDHQKYWREIQQNVRKAAAESE